MDENLPATIPPIQVPNGLDFTIEEYSKLLQFKKDGSPGVSRISDQSVFKWHNLYLAGKSYEEIAQQTKSDVCLIMLISEKHQWAEKKDRYHAAIAETVQARVMGNKMESLVFLTDVMGFFHNTTGKQIREFLETKNEKIAEKIDLKALDKYFKASEAIEKLVFKKEDDDKKPTAVFNNFFGKTTIKKNGDNSVTIESGEAESDSSIIDLEAHAEAIENEEKK